MDFSSVNWLAIGFAVGANMLLGYIWFDSGAAKTWKEAVQGSAVSEPWKRYGFLLAYSLVVSLFVWFLFAAFGASLGTIVMLLWGVIVTGNRFTYEFAGKKKDAMFEVKHWFFLFSLVITTFLVVLSVVFLVDI